MTHRIHLQIARAEGVLVRVLGTAERRGFRPVAISAEEQGDGMILMELMVAADRPIERLVRQLSKLYDVVTIEAEAAELPMMAAAAK